MKKLISAVLFLSVMFAAQTKTFAASSDLWCVGSATKGECINATGAIIPAADGTHNLGSAAKSFGSAWMDGTVTVNNLVVTGTLSPYSTGTFTGQSIVLDYGLQAATAAFSGAISAASYGAVAGTSGAFSTTMDVNGQATFGADNTVSTIPAAGSPTFHGTVTATAALTAPNVIASAIMRIPSLSLATIMAKTAVMGDMFICNNCSPVEIAISTAAGAPNTGGYGNAAGLQLD